MLLMIDNYDSFTYNLVQYFGELGAELCVFRNDEISLAEIKKMQPSHIVISPGPGRPAEAGISKAVIANFYRQIPILGVCLGHQAIGEVFGAKIVNAPTLVHGKTSPIFHHDTSVFKGLPLPFLATRYHSLVVEPVSLPPELLVSAWTAEQIIMGLQHRQYPLAGVQFHPESILTTHGKKILANFLAVQK